MLTIQFIPAPQHKQHYLATASLSMTPLCTTSFGIFVCTTSFGIFISLNSCSRLDCTSAPLMPTNQRQRKCNYFRPHKRQALCRAQSLRFHRLRTSAIMGATQAQSSTREWVLDCACGAPIQSRPICSPFLPILFSRPRSVP